MMKFLVPLKKLTAISPDRQRNQSFHVAKGQKVIKSEAVCLWREAEDIVADAKQEAERILNSTQAAFDQEKQRGYEEGLDQAKSEQVDHMIEQVARSVDYFETIEKRVVDLVLSSVKKIIYDFRDEERTISVVKNALSTVRNQKKVLIRTHPSEVEIVSQKLNSLLAEFPSINYIDVVSDTRLKKDGCVLETDIGLVEVNIESQLKGIRNAFERVLGRQHNL